MRKILVAFCALTVFFLGGCGKKNTESGKGAVISAAKEVAQNDIPVYEYDEEKFLDADSVADFAFIDEGDIAEEQALAIEEAVLDDEPILWEEEKELFTFKNINFDLNKNAIRGDQQDIVAENIEIAKEALEEGKEVIILGHSCQLGAASYNLSLSERRAKVIKDEMVKKGIPASKVKIVGCGAEMPLIWTDKTDRTEMVAELAINRRAEITLS